MFCALLLDAVFGADVSRMVLNGPHILIKHYKNTMRETVIGNAKRKRGKEE